MNGNFSNNWLNAGIIMLCFIISSNAFAKNPPAIKREVMLNIIKPMTVIIEPPRFGAFELILEMDEFFFGGSVKLFPTISTDSKPISNYEAREESDKTEDPSVVSDDLLQLLKEHWFNWVSMFLLGLICGGAFGWPPFSKN